jgi:tetratricopeptide (TPR) repeat protein
MNRGDWLLPVLGSFILAACARAQTSQEQWPKASTPQQAAPDETYEQQRAFAQDLFNNNHQLEALPVFEDLAKRNPRDADALLGLGGCLLQHSATVPNADAARQERIRARSLLLRAKELGNNGILLNNLLDTLPADGSLRYPGNPEVVDAIERGEAAFAKNDYAEAIVHYFKSMELDPKNYSAALFIADCYFTQKNFSKAAQWYDHAIQINPDLETAYRYQADMFTKNGDQKRAPPGDPSDSRGALYTVEIAALLALQHGEGETSYWDLFHNTIFYGWGFTGRIDTTALVLDALASAGLEGKPQPDFDRALSRGTLFLLKNKDRYGVWYSTQATVNVLQSLVWQLGATASSGDRSQTPLRILVDGKPGPQISASTDLRQLTPQRADLSAYLSPGPHKIEIHGGSDIHASAYVNASYFLPWTDPSVMTSSVRSGDAESLRYSVQFDRTTASTGDAIRCTVHVERVGFRGYGMMLAEVGPPPGADVDRASLDSAQAGPGWDIQSYEIQPDRVVFYLWPQGSGTTFSFTMKPRYGMSAASAESILYDYYNPQARASVPPARFVVQ